MLSFNKVCKQLLLIIGLIGLTCSSLFARQVTDSAYIHTGLFSCLDSNTLPAHSISLSDEFRQQQELIKLSIGDTLQLIIFNRDTVDHELTWLGASASVFIKAGDQASTLYLAAAETGTYIASKNADLRYNGLILPLAVLANQPVFLWDIHEKSKSASEALFQGIPMNPKLYDPEYFFINGLANPETLSDSLARVKGAVGDSITIMIVNSGHSIHSLHFHGYHLEVLSSSRSQKQVGRSKDTFPVWPGECLRLLLVPDKPGEYPVHDHNLIAVSGGGIYPNGMFTTLLIQ